MWCRLNKRNWRAHKHAKTSIENELDVLSYLRKMKTIDAALKTLFSDKERYLLRKHDSFVMNTSLKSLDEAKYSEIDSDGDDGPKNSEKWWSDLNSQ